MAVLLVLLYHYPTAFDPQSAMQGILNKVEWVGWAGVDLFFVLSGFLIANLLFTEFRARRTIDFGRFWTRRAFKIYPQFYLLLLLWVTRVLRPETPPTMSGVLGEAFFVQNYGPHLWSHTWSLAVEEHFYLLIGILFTGGIGQVCVRRWPWVVGAILVSCLALRVWMALSITPFNLTYHLFQTHLRLDSLFVGSAVAYLLAFHGTRTEALVRRLRWPLLGVAAALIASGFSRQLDDTIFVQTIGLSLLGLGFSVIVALIVFGAFSFVPPVGGDAVLLVGRASYAIYLWHMATLRQIVPAIDKALGIRPGYGELLLYLTLSIAIGIALTQWLERPCLLLRERYFPRRTAECEPAR